MADPKHLKVLKQGVVAWNQWRKEHADIQPNLRQADLRDSYLVEADLSNADLVEADLSNADLRGANLTRVDLTLADLTLVYLIGADLTEAKLIGANLTRSYLSSANLSGADFTRSHLGDTDLSGADLAGADFKGADLREVNLSLADLKEAQVGWTIFADVDLSAVKGLDTLKHSGGPSTIGIDTIIRSQGHIPESFLRNAGVPDSIIEAIPSLIGSLRPIDYYSCFISYSSMNQDFAERLYDDLQGKGVRCWFAPEDLNIGDKLRPRIDETIRKYEKLLLVLSEHSIASTWVAYEVERALNKEPEGVPNVLYPIRLDDTVMGCKTGWAEDIRRTRHIGDFTHWKEYDAYQKALNRLLRALKADERR